METLLRGRPRNLPQKRPKTSSEVELMETSNSRRRCRRLLRPKTSSEVELMETWFGQT